MSKQLYTTTACDFLKNICNVANLLLLLTNSETNSSKKKKKKIHVLQSVQQPKEYQELAGYRPFQSFVCSSGNSASGNSSNNYATSKIKGGYVSMEEAAIVLELHASTSLSMTQESTTTTTTTTPKDENKIKIHRFLDAVDRFVGRTITTAGKIVRQDNKGENQRGYVFQEAESGTTSQQEDNYDDGDEAMEDHVEVEKEAEEDDMDNHNDDVGIGVEEATSMEDVMPVVVTTTSAKQEESSTKKQKNDESTQSSSDVLVYKESKDNGGTPLLVPGDLLMNLTGKKDVQTPQETRAPAAVEDHPTMIPQARATTPGVVIPTDRAPSASPQPLGRPPSSPSPALPPGFGPPPGFAGGTTDVGGSDVGIGRLMSPQPQLGPSSSNPVSSMLPPGFPSHAPVQQQQQQQQQQQGVPMMGGSQLLAPGAIPGPSNQHLPYQQQAFPPPPMPMFGYPGTVPQTANPFAAAPQYMMAPVPPQGQLQQHRQQSQQLPPPPPPQQQMGWMGVMPSTTSVDPYSTGLFGGPAPTDQSGSGEKDSGFMEGASLLDSSLLNTLYIDENSQHEKDDENRGLPFSQNPFLK